MKYSYMDSKLIEINMIEEIYSITSFDLLNPNDSNGKLIGFSVQARLTNNEIVDLTYFSNDIHFQTFTSKIISYYKENKDEFIDNNIITLELGKKKKRIDKRSKEYFDKIENNQLKEKVISLFENSTKNDYSLFNISSLESNLNILISELKKIFQYLSEEFEIIERINTFNNNFVIKIKRNGKYETIPCLYEEVDENTSKFSLGNIFKPGFVELYIYNNEDKLSIKWECLSKGLTSFLDYTFKTDVKKQESLLSLDDLLFYQSDTVESTTPLDSLNIYFDYMNEDINKYTFYKLNDHDYYAFYEEESKHESCLQRNIRKIRFSIINDKIHVLDNYYEILSTDSITINTNGFRIDSLIIQGKEEMLMESIFKESECSSGSYKSTLDGKVIYTRLQRNKKEDANNLTLKHIREVR